MICAKVRLGVIRYRNAMSALRPLYLDEPTSSADRLRPKSARSRLMQRTFWTTGSTPLIKARGRAYGAGSMSNCRRNRYTKTCREIAQDSLIMPAQYSSDVEADKTFRARSPTGPSLVGLAVRARTGGQRVSNSRRLSAWREDRRFDTFGNTGPLRTGHFSK
jgi:hypothetical protein